MKQVGYPQTVDLIAIAITVLHLLCTEKPLTKRSEAPSGEAVRLRKPSRTGGGKGG